MNSESLLFRACGNQFPSRAPNKSTCDPRGRSEDTKLLLNRHFSYWRMMSVIAFHEKAGRSQVDSCRASLNKVFFSRRVATVAMLPFALLRAIGFARCTLGVLVSAGAAICLAPCGSALAEWNLGQAINAVTGTRLWLLFFSSSWERFRFFTQLPPLSLGCCCAMVCRLLRSPTGDAATRPAFWPSR